MIEALGSSLFLGIGLTLGGFLLGSFLKNRYKIFIFNPLLVSITVCIATLLLLDIDYNSYNKGASHISMLLTPATVCLAIPLYEQLQLFSTGDFLINVPDKGILYETQDRKIAEAIMVNYPEKAETLDTIQIHGVYLSNFGNNRGNTAETLLRKSIDEYMSGKETFKRNIYNVAQLGELREFAFKSGMYSLEDLDKRIAETQKDMLATIDERKIRFLSDDALTFVSQIAEKYPEDTVAKGVRQASQREITQRNNEKSRDL